MIAEVTSNATSGEVPIASLAAIVIGLVTPLFTSVINRPTMTKQYRMLVAIGAAVVLGILNLVVQGAVFNWEWSVAGVATNLVLVIGASQTAYATLWKPTGVANVVEEKTSPQQ